MIFHFAPWDIFYTSRRAIICLGQETILVTDSAWMSDLSQIKEGEKKSEAHSKDYPEQDCIYTEVVLVPLHLEMTNYVFSSLN